MARTVFLNSSSEISNGYFPIELLVYQDFAKDNSTGGDELRSKLVKSDIERKQGRNDTITTDNNDGVSE